MASDSLQPTLVLHLDVNKTIVMMDPVSKVTLPRMVNALVSECVWGRVNTKKKPITWRCVSKVPSSLAPEQNDLTEDAAALEGEDVLLCPYADFVDMFFPYGTDTSENRAIKMQRKELTGTFTDAGRPGEAFKAVHTELMASLTLPANVAALGDKLPTRLRDGKHFLLPSFFELLLHLERTKRNYAIVFRTFGIDSVEVAEELNAFCNGEHPCYPGVKLDGTQHSDLRLHVEDNPLCLASWFRCDVAAQGATSEEKKVYRAAKDGIALVRGTLDQPDWKGDIGLNFYEQHKDKAKLQITEGYEATLDILMKMCAIHSDGAKQHSGQRCVSTRDFYPHWARHVEATEAGKPLLLRKNHVDADGRPIHQIFIDDNVDTRSGRAKIVDARWTDGTPVPWEQAKDCFIAQSYPLEAIRNPKFFIELLSKCEKTFAAKFNSSK